MCISSYLEEDVHVFMHVPLSSRSSLDCWNLRTGSATVRVRGLSSAEVGGQSSRGRHETRRLGDTAARPHRDEGQQFAVALGREHKDAGVEPFNNFIASFDSSSRSEWDDSISSCRSYTFNVNLFISQWRGFYYTTLLFRFVPTFSLLWTEVRAQTSKTNISQRTVGGLDICTPP